MGSRDLFTRLPMSSSQPYFAKVDRMLPKLSRIACPLLLVALITPARAFAVSKDMIQLQTQIQQLQDAVARLQQSNDERMGVLKDLVQQSADQMNKVAGTVDSLQRQMQTQQESGGGKIDQVSGQVQSMNDSLDEIKARLGRLEKLMQDVQNQQQSIGSSPATASAAPLPSPSSAPSDAGALPASGLTSASPDTPSPRRNSKPSAGTPVDNSLNAPPAAASAGSNPPADQLYKTALGDYMAAKYGLAQSEFSDLSSTYPDNPLSGNAFYYQGEMDYRGARYGAAIKDYDRVLEQYPESNKVPAAHLHKGQALVQLKQTDAGVRELRSLIQRFPNSPEALQARSKLSGLGVPVKPRAEQ